MPRPPRTQYAGAYYHVMNRGVNKLIIVKDDRDCRTFLSLLAQTVEKFDLALFAYCLMPNHFHLFFRIQSANLSDAMWFLQLNFSRYINKRHHRVGHLFQSRFLHRNVYTEDYGLELPRYIHLNPVRAGLVMNPDDYSWSSYGSYTGKLPAFDWLNTDWLLDQLDPTPGAARIEVFKAFHKKAPSRKIQTKLDKMRASLSKKPTLTPITIR